MLPSIPKVSVVIANYNYERYLPQAIESALNQDHRNMEVVVVDDGSTDGSHRILERYARHITAVRKANGGEASARNAGFADCTGDIVIFLDADDYLYSDAASRIVDKFEAGVAKVHYPLEIVDADGQSTGQILAGRLVSGDMTSLLREFGFYPSPPTSGNAYSRDVLERIMPIPEPTFAGYSDTYSIVMSALYGEVRALRAPCAAWRRHNNNMTKHDVKKLPERVRQDLAAVEMMNGVLRERGSSEAPRVAAWPQHLQQRLTVAKLLPAWAGPHDSVESLRARYIDAVWRWPAYSTTKRVAATAWALIFAALPPSLLRGVASNPTRLTSLTYRLIK